MKEIGGMIINKYAVRLAMGIAKPHRKFDLLRGLDRDYLEK